MGTRDTLILNANIKIDFAKALKNKINYLNNLMYQELEDELEKDKIGLAVLLNYEDNLNFKESKIHYSRLHTNEDFALLTVNAKMKNYNNEFEKFLNYIAPNIVNLEGPSSVDTLGFIKHDNDDLTVDLIQYNNDHIEIKRG